MKQVTVNQMSDVAHKLVQRMKNTKVFTFTGPLGAGKTTLVQNMLRKCGVKGPIQSPTYTYITIYKNDDGTTFYHFDLYRLDTLDDFLQAGFDEYLYQPNSFCFIEWPEIIMFLLKKDVSHITLEYGPEVEGQQTRLLKVEPNLAEHVEQP